MPFLAHRELKKISSLSPLVPFQEVVVVVRLLHAKKDDGLLGKEGGEGFGRERGGSRVAEMIEGDRVRQSTESEVFNGAKH